MDNSMETSSSAHSPSSSDGSCYDPYEDAIRNRQADENLRYNQLLKLMHKSDLFVKMIFQRMEESKKKAEAQIERLKKPSRKRLPQQSCVRKGKKRRTKLQEVKEEDSDVEEVVDTEESDETKPEIHDGKAGEYRSILFTGGSLRSYQVEGVKWLTSLYENGISGILADEMGLGKTVQVIAAIATMIERGVTGPFLIIAPLTTLSNWVNEFNRFAPYIPVTLYYAAKDDRAVLREDISKCTKLSNGIKTYPVLVSSYDIVRNDAKLLRYSNWKCVVVDEGHRLKNHNCVLLKALKYINANQRLLLTGTPLQNDIRELWSLLNYILPEIFNNLQTFEEWIDKGSLSDESGRKHIVAQEKEKRILALMHQILTPFMLRRLKSDVDLTIPPKREIVLHAPLTKYQKKLYDKVLDGTIEEIRKAKEVEAEGETDENAVPTSSKRRSRVDLNYNEDDLYDTIFEENERRNQLKNTPKAKVDYEVHLRMSNPLMILRRIINHGHMVEYPLDKNGQYCLDKRLIEHSGKIQVLNKLLPALKSRGHKVLIFSQFTSMLDIIQDYLNYVGFKYSRIDGNMKLDERDDQIKWFSETGDIFIFLISTRAGGLGLNLIAADTVIFYDSDWNPQCDIQAQDRCHRIGQTKPVLVYRLLTPNTVEEKIYESAISKRTLERLIIHGRRFKKSLESRDQWEDAEFHISDDELLKILSTRGDETTVNIKVYDEKYLNQILDRSDLLSQWSTKLNVKTE